MAKKPSYSKLKGQLRRLGRLQRGLAGIICLAFAYIVASLALDTGSWWEYGLALLLIVVGLRNLIRLIKGN